MSLHELVYVSLAEHPMSREELGELLGQARRHNLQSGITGLLIYRDREFMQLIEGERDAVMQLYALIEGDRRHQQIYKMWDGPIAARSCSGWAMGFIEPTESIVRSVPEGRLLLDEGLFAAGRASSGRRLLQHLRDQWLVAQA